MDIFILFSGWWVLGTLVATLAGTDTKLGWLGTLLISLFLSPAVGAICAHCTGLKEDRVWQRNVLGLLGKEKGATTEKKQEALN